MGYGWLPRFLVQAPLAEGMLRALPLSSQASRKTPIYLSFGNDALSYDPTVASLAAIIQQGVEEARAASSFWTYSEAEMADTAPSAPLDNPESEVDLA